MCVSTIHIHTYIPKYISTSKNRNRNRKGKEMNIMKNSLLLPMLMGEGLGGGGAGDTDFGLSMLKYKLLFDDKGSSGSDEGDTSDQLTTLYMLVPAAKQMVQKVGDKLTSMDEGTKNQIVAAAVVKALADNMLADAPDDELAQTLRDVSDEMLTQFVFTNQLGRMAHEQQERRQDSSDTGSLGQGSIGAHMLSERKIGEDIVKSIPVNGNRDVGVEEQSQKVTMRQTKKTAKRTPTKKKVADTSEAVAGLTNSPF